MNNTKLLNETLQSLGISKCYKGYRQLYMSVELALDDDSRLECITDCIIIRLQICVIAIAAILNETSERLPAMRGM